MPFTKLQFKPGITSDITSYSNEGGYVDGDKIRFRLGFPEKIGGWEKYSATQYLGSARSLHNWSALDGSNFLGIGTTFKYYIEEGLSFNDITPERATTTNGITFAATNGSATITATDSAHGAVEGDFVVISGAASLGGTITAAVLNIEHQIVTVPNANTYTITASVNANGSDTGTGGAGVDGVYQINTGLDTTVGGTGWGAGLFSGITTSALQTQLNEALDNSETAVDVDDETGMTTANDVILVDEELMLVASTTDDNTMTVTRGHSGTTAVAHDDNTLVRLAVGNASGASDFSGWGDAASGGVTTTGELRIWSEDNFGEDLLINPRDGEVYYWDKSDNLSTRAVEISTESGASDTPTVAKQIMVSDQDRHVIAFGTNTIGTTIQDPLLIRFSSQESLLDWTPTATNTAGDLRLGGGSEFIQAVETKQAILVFTDKTLHAMKFIGPPFTFGLQELSKNITIISPKSAVPVGDVVYWMGRDTFYIYSGGQTQQIPCTVKDKVFLDINTEQFDKVFGGVNSEFNEIIWFYPNASNTNNSNYVIFNYADNTWYYGTLARDAWIDRGLRTNALAAGGGYIFNQEIGFDDDGVAMDSFVETAPIDIGDGEKFVFIKRIIPDITFSGSSALSSPSATFTLKARNFPGVNFTDSDTGTTTRTSTSPVEAFTEKLDVRVRGRSFALRIESDSLGCKWKLGSPRVDIREDGRR
jgi:hypothetical protein|tara:strand:+ start:174 stop:2285 length:2112 start_codon:yes stop_codon:yes gene_type:complete